jgi:hypothetical protein
MSYSVPAAGLATDQVPGLSLIMTTCFDYNPALLCPQSALALQLDRKPLRGVSDSETRFASCRKHSDEIDQQIVALLNQRARIVAVDRIVDPLKS